MDGYRITNDKRYLDEVKPHLVALERFDGFQPHYKLNSVAIRFWDAYWFGKYEEFGDTLPHQCSAISSMLYNRYGKLTNDQDYINKSINGLRNCLACFEPNGRAHASSIFPYRCNGKPGNTLDVFANDQDSILYLATDILLNE